MDWTHMAATNTSHRALETLGRFVKWGNECRFGEDWKKEKASNCKQRSKGNLLDKQGNRNGPRGVVCAVCFHAT
ncbi:unnamed protein product, partial [Urochloa humidicola]